MFFLFFDENACGNVTQCVVRRVREGTAERGRAGAQKTRPVAGGETPELTPPGLGTPTCHCAHHINSSVNGTMETYNCVRLGFFDGHLQC